MFIEIDEKFDKSNCARFSMWWKKVHNQGTYVFAFVSLKIESTEVSDFTEITPSYGGMSAVYFDI